MKSAAIKDWRHLRPEVFDMSSWTKLTYLDISNTHFVSVPIFPSTLTHLEAAFVGIASYSSNLDVDREAVFPFSKLEYLSVEGGALGIIVNDMANPALTSGSLKTLKVGCEYSSIRGENRNDWIHTLPAYSPALKTLWLDRNVELPEETIITVLRQFPNLKEVNLSGTGATGSTLRELFERDSKPEFVDMRHCENCYHDAVEVAREAGIEVRHELAPKNNKMGRKLRDQYFD